MTIQHKGQFKKGFIPWNKGKKGLQVAWNKGVPLSDDVKKKLSDSLSGRVAWNKGKKTGLSWNSGKTGLQIAWNKGKKWLEWMPEDKRADVLKNFSKSKGENHWNWKGGITSENHLIRQSIEYREWRRSVFERDRFTCVKCGYRSVKKRDIRADHIKPFSLFPELRFEVSNGRTFCLKCDLKYGWNYLRDVKNKIKSNK